LTDDTHSQLTNSVKSLTDNMRQRFDACKGEKDKLKKLLLDRRNEVKVAEKEITDKAGEMISLVQSLISKQRDELLDKLHSQNDETISSLESDSQRLSSTLSVNKTALRFAEELLEKGSFEDMLLNYRMLNDRVKTLHNMPRVISVLADNVCNDVSSDSLIHAVCSSLYPQSMIYTLLLYPVCLIKLTLFMF